MRLQRFHHRVGLCFSIAGAVTAAWVAIACGADSTSSTRRTEDADDAGAGASSSGGENTKPAPNPEAVLYDGEGTVLVFQAVDDRLRPSFDILAQFVARGGESPESGCAVLTRGDCAIRSCPENDAGTYGPTPQRDVGPIVISGAGFADAGIALTAREDGVYTPYSLLGERPWPDGGVVHVANTTQATHVEAAPIFDETLTPPGVVTALTATPEVDRDGWIEATWTTDGIAPGDRMRLAYRSVDTSPRRVHLLQCEFDATLGRGVVRPELTSQFGQGTGVAQLTTLRQKIVVSNHWKVTILVGTAVRNGALFFSSR